MIITTIAALTYASYQSLTKIPASPGNIVAGIIGIILIIAALIMCL